MKTSHNLNKCLLALFVPISLLLVSCGNFSDDSSKQIEQGASYGLSSLQGPASCTTQGLAGTLQVPQCSSNPNSPLKIFLDFDGASAMTWPQYTVPTTPAYDLDGNALAFNAKELSNIQDIWVHVVEKFSPFNVDVTTIDPGYYDNGKVLKVLIGGDGAWYHTLTNFIPSAATLGSFSTPGQDNTVYVFFNMYQWGSAETIAQNIAALAAKNMGLTPQGVYLGSGKPMGLGSFAYNPGDNWVAPILGSVRTFGIFPDMRGPRLRWWKGYSVGFEIQDDMAEISTLLGYRVDDHGNTSPIATPLSVSGSGFMGSGIIENTSDVDDFSFYSPGGTTNISADIPHGGMLNLKLELRDSSDHLIASADTEALGEFITANLQAGNYYILVSSHGDYGDVGQYSVRVAPQVLAAPTNLIAQYTLTQANVSWTNQAIGAAGVLLQISKDGGWSWNDLATLAADANSYVGPAPLEGVNVVFRVYALGLNGIRSAPCVSSVYFPLPTAPGNSGGQALSASAVGIEWTPVRGVTGYFIERSTDNATWSPLVTVSPTTTFYLDSGLTAGVYYYYRIYSVGPFGRSKANTESYGPVYSFNTLQAPTSFSVFRTIKGTRLIWSNPSISEVYQFVVQRSSDGGDTWSTVTTTSPVQANRVLTDTTANESTTYQYRVYSSNPAGNSPMSPAVTVAASCEMPGNFTLGSSTSNQINLILGRPACAYPNGGPPWWLGFQIERSIDNSNWVVAGRSLFSMPGITTSNIVNFTDSGLQPDTRYYYRIRALFDDGISAPTAVKAFYASGLADTTAPTVTLSSPISGATLSGRISLVAAASDNVDVVRVQFFVDGANVGIATAPPYSFSLDTKTLSNASHSFLAIANDMAGNSGRSSVVSATVYNGIADSITPTATISSPIAGASVSGTINVQASGADNVGVTRLEIFVDGISKGSVASTSYTMPLNVEALSLGAHNLQAKAFDAAGNIGASPIVSINVVDAQAPVVSLSAPLASATLSGSISISASASDNRGVTKVEFFVDGLMKGSATSSPYSITLDTNNLSNATHNFLAKAYDVAGNMTSSASVSATVNNYVAPPADTTAPTVAVTSPSSGATLTGSVAITVNAQDNIGVVKVEFLVDGGVRQTSTTAPFSFSFSSVNMPNGAHTITARAYDAANNLGTSAPVSVTINNLPPPPPPPADTIAPVVAITSPANGALVPRNTYSTVAVSATDNIRVSGVDIMIYAQGATSPMAKCLGLSSAPFSCRWRVGKKAGKYYTIKALARDAAGNVGAATNVTVKSY